MKEDIENEAEKVERDPAENTWLEAIVRYLVHPREAGRVKTRLIKELLLELNQHPDKVKFPKSDMR